MFVLVLGLMEKCWVTLTFQHFSSLLYSAQYLFFVYLYVCDQLFLEHKPSSLPVDVARSLSLSFCRVFKLAFDHNKGSRNNSLLAVYKSNLTIYKRWVSLNICKNMYPVQKSSLLRHQKCNKSQVIY